MKKICLLLVGLLLSSVAMATSLPFTGFSGSLDFGLITSDISDDRSVNVFLPGAENISFFSSPRLTATSLDGGVRLGYDIGYKAFRVGFALDGNFGNNNVNLNLSHVEENSHLNIPVNTNVKLQSRFAVLLRFGSLIGNRAMFYGLLGPQFASFSINSSASDYQNIGAIISSSVRGSQNGYQTGVLVGVGAEELLTHFLSLGIEYTYIFYGNLSFPSNLSNSMSLNGTTFPGSVFSDVNHLNAKVSNVMLKLGFYFSS